MATSRPYKIKTNEVVGKTIVAEDHVTVQLDIPPLLPKEQTATILADTLKQRKFRQDEGGNLVRERAGVKIIVDPQQGSMTISAEAETNLPPPEDDSPCSCRARARLREKESIHNDLQRQVTRRLEGAIGKLGCEIEGVIHKVTVESLKQKARQLGEIKQITEDARSGAITIVLKV